MSAPTESRDPRLRALGSALGSALEHPPEPSQVARSRALFLATRTPPPRRLRGALALAAAVFLGVLGWRLAHREGALQASFEGQTLLPGRWASAEHRPTTLRFSEGTALTLAPGAQVRLAAVSDRGASVLLERGTLEVSVRRRPHGRWTVAAGPYTVEVTGTAFGLRWTPEARALDLSMHHGRVLVRGPRCGDGVSLQGHEELHARLGDGTLLLGALPSPPVPSPGPSSPTSAPPGAPEAPSEPSPPTPRPTRTHTPPRPAPVGAAVPGEAPRSPPSGWRERALEGRWREAMDALDDGAFHGAVASADPGELWLLADAARLAGAPWRAREALLALRARAPEGDRPRAAYVLGVLHLEPLGAPSVAARWFGVYLQEAPDGALVEEAHGRRVQALRAAGDAAGSREAAEGYLARWPRGSFAEYARGVMDATFP